MNKLLFSQVNVDIQFVEDYILKVLELYCGNGELQILIILNFIFALSFFLIDQAKLGTSL